MNDIDDFQFSKIDIKPALDALGTFIKNMKPIQEMVQEVMDNIRNFVRLIAERMRPIKALEPLADNQYIIWEYMDEEFVDMILSSNNINKTLRFYHEKEKYNSVYETAEKCCENIHDKTLQRLFNQAVRSFKEGNTDLAVVGFVSVIDGLLAVVNDSTSTRISREFKSLVQKLENEQVLDDTEYAIFSLFYTFNKTVEIFTANSDFHGKEPKGLNRHWIAHGRSRRKKTKLDCVKLIKIIYGIILIDKHSKE